VLGQHCLVKLILAYSPLYDFFDDTHLPLLLFRKKARFQIDEGRHVVGVFG